MHFPSFHPPICLSRHQNIVLGHRYDLLLSCLCFLTCLRQRSDSYTYLFPSLVSFSFFCVYPNRSVALLFFPLLLPFTLSTFSGYGFRLQQASCTDRLSRGLLENTVQEQKCKQVERSFVELHSFPCHHTLTLNIPLSSACVVCCGGFCGPKLPKSTLLCMRSPANNQPSSPRCRSLLQWESSERMGSSLDPCHFAFGAQNSPDLQIHTNTQRQTLFRMLFAGGQVSPI